MRSSDVSTGICRENMAGETDEEYEDLAHKQRLKAALHYTVGQVCQEVEGGAFSRELVATISETAFRQCETLATDLEHFAKHGKRTTVSAEDVKLCCRRSPSLQEFIGRQSDSLRAAREGGEEGGRRKGRKGHRDKGKELETAAAIEDSD